MHKTRGVAYFGLSLTNREFDHEARILHLAYTPVAGAALLDFIEKEKVRGGHTRFEVTADWPAGNIAEIPAEVRSPVQFNGDVGTAMRFSDLWTGYNRGN